MSNKTKKSAAAQQLYADLAAKCIELDAHLTDDLFTTDPAHAAAVAQVKALMQIIREAGSVPADNSAGLVIRDVVRTWEVAENSDEGLSEEQKQPWRVQAMMTGNGLSLEVWPASQQKDEAEVGFGVWFEISKGRPALHIGPGPLCDPSLHVVCIGPDHIEASPNSGRAAPTVDSQAYPGTISTVYRNVH